MIYSIENFSFFPSKNKQYTLMLYVTNHCLFMLNCSTLIMLFIIMYLSIQDDKVKSTVNCCSYFIHTYSTISIILVYYRIFNEHQIFI